jgi:hypothetical protein
MEDLFFVYATGALVAIYLAAHVCAGKFDPFAPSWLFLVGYVHVYVIQAVSYHDWAVGIRGKDLVDAAGLRAFWALLLFLVVYHLPIGRRLSACLPRPPAGWSPALVGAISPPLIVWGLLCAGILLGDGLGVDPTAMSGEEVIFRSFPFVMMVAATMLIVTGRTMGVSRPWFLAAGLLTSAAYVVIWMYNGKRSHSVIAVLATVCACYVTRLKRPSWPVLLATSFAGSLVVAIAIGWRNNLDYERSFAGFAQYLGDFKVEKILENLDLADKQDLPSDSSHETSEYGGFLLMLDTVPAKSGFDHGANYLRVFSTFIPRIAWPSKPLFGRDAWVSAWMAGSELERKEDFAGPAIGILGAAQLNGGAVGTGMVVAGIALILRLAYEYFRRYAHVPWAQFFWAITFYNAWFMVVGDDPLTWFYYNWGYSAFPLVLLLWWASKRAPVAAGPEVIARANPVAWQPLRERAAACGADSFAR